MEYLDGRLTGVIKNLSGCVDAEFMSAMEVLMEKHKINYVQLCWRYWRDETIEKEANEDSEIFTE